MYIMFPKVWKGTHPSQESEKLLADQFASFFQTTLRKLEILLLPLALNTRLTLLQILHAVDKIVKTSPTKSCLIDPWPIFLIKECIDILLPLLTKLVNCWLMEGCVPDAFKFAVVTPLIKKPNLPSDDLKSYRPVSGLSLLSKLVECVVARQLLGHIHMHNLDNLYQTAYKAGHSTETVLLSIKKEVHLSLSRGKPTAIVLLNLSAAFDNINHSTLLSCLSIWFGVGGSVLKWFTSYRTDRYQSTKNWFYFVRCL